MQWKWKLQKWISHMLSLPILIVLLITAVYKSGWDSFKNENEMISDDELDYIRQWGYQAEVHRVKTEDGHILTMYRIYRHTPIGKPPVLIGHGLFQCSGVFVLNEQKSLVFTLIDEGYDVWVGNNRSVSSEDHVYLTSEDPEYWKWGIKELAVYDLPAMIHHVLSLSPYKKISYIGHSQGNTQAFVALRLCPELHEKLNGFIALAPALFAGKLTSQFPLRCLIQMNTTVYQWLFGQGQFLSIMSMAQQYIEPYVFSHLAYSVFSYLFHWWDHQWIKTRKIKYFQFTPRAVSSQLISDWMVGWGRQGMCVYLNEPSLIKTSSPVPLVLFYGTADYLVDGDKVVQCMDENKLFPMLKLVHTEKITGYEHMDTLWAHNNHITTYPILLDQLNRFQ
ncbi:Alpha/Beta hydrolase protein [Pilobolus umbonatus]|nr:Alpha/Beta hydrolase protein [Pilobolus umbonatus]